MCDAVLYRERERQQTKADVITGATNCLVQSTHELQSSSGNGIALPNGNRDSKGSFCRGARANMASPSWHLGIFRKKKKRPNFPPPAHLLVRNRFQCNTAPESIPPSVASPNSVPRVTTCAHSSILHTLHFRYRVLVFPWQISSYFPVAELLCMWMVHCVGNLNAINRPTGSVTDSCHIK